MKNFRYTIILTIILSFLFQIEVFADSDSNKPEVIVMFTGEYNGNFVNTESVIGMDVVASLYDKISSDTNAAFLIDCGDTIQGSFFSNSNEGEAAIDIMNAVGYDAMTLGNHEFDYGYDRLLSLAKKANFPFLTQPSVFNDNEPLNHSVILERSGYKVGVFGLTTPATKQISYAFDKNFGNPSQLIDYAKKAASNLRENGADIVICLAHIGMADNLAHDFGSVIDISENVLGIDVIIDGHTTGDYDLSRVNTPIIYTNSNACTGTIEFYQKDNGFDLSINILNKENVADVTPDKDVEAVINKWQQSVDELGKSIIGHSAATVNDYEKSIIRYQETALGNLVADAVRKASDSEIALVNAGNIRAGLSQGDVTWSDINNVLPFSNYILCGTVKGSDLKAVIEHSLALRETENGGGFFQVSGLSFSFNSTLPESERIIDINVNGVSL